MCQQACPTYAVFGTEMDSPRGRIALLRAVSTGRIEPDEFKDVFAVHAARCLTCRACESACPAGVQYGKLIETARVAIEIQRTPTMLERVVRWLGFRQLMPHVERMKLLARLMWLYEASGFQRLFRAMTRVPRTLKAMEAILPPIVPHYCKYHAPARAIGKKRGAVAFFIGCVQEAFLPQVNEATIRVLQQNGYEVHFPSGQTCCGAAQLHMGEQNLARELARKNMDAFLSRD
jgi:Fe-S oxidoreductase